MYSERHPAQSRSSPISRGSRAGRDLAGEPLDELVDRHVTLG
jgi:hypothetical protein